MLQKERRMDTGERPSSGDGSEGAEELPVIDLGDDENEDWLRTVRRRREQREAEARTERERGDQTDGTR